GVEPLHTLDFNDDQIFDRQIESILPYSSSLIDFWMMSWRWYFNPSSSSSMQQASSYVLSSRPGPSCRCTSIAHLMILSVRWSMVSILRASVPLWLPLGAPHLML